MSDRQIKRRRFLGRGLKGAGVVGFGGVCWSSYRFMSAEDANLADYLAGSGPGAANAGVALGGGGKDVTSVELDAGSIGPGQSRIVAIGYTPVIVVRGAGGWKAFDATCTHLGCLVKWESALNKFVCPCHAGTYDADGRRLSGPPPVGLRKCKVEESGGKLKGSVA